MDSPPRLVVLDELLSAKLHHLLATRLPVGGLIDGLDDRLQLAEVHDATASLHELLEFLGGLLRLPLLIGEPVGRRASSRFLLRRRDRRQGQVAGGGTSGLGPRDGVFVVGGFRL